MELDFFFRAMVFRSVANFAVLIQSVLGTDRGLILNNLNKEGNEL